MTSAAQSIPFTKAVLLSPFLIEGRLKYNYIFRPHLYMLYYKRGSLACAARLADTLCPLEAPFGNLSPHELIMREISLNTSVFML